MRLYSTNGLRGDDAKHLYCISVILIRTLNYLLIGDLSPTFEKSPKAWMFFGLRWVSPGVAWRTLNTVKNLKNFITVFMLLWIKYT